MVKNIFIAAAATLLVLGAGAATAAEYPAGDPVMINGMEVVPDQSDSDEEMAKA